MNEYRDFKMKYKWVLKSISTNRTIREGDIKAKDQDEAMRRLNKSGIKPHEGEVLELVTPMDLSDEGSEPLILR